MVTKTKKKVKTNIKQKQTQKQNVVADINIKKKKSTKKKQCVKSSSSQPTPTNRPLRLRPPSLPPSQQPITTAFVPHHKRQNSTDRNRKKEYSCTCYLNNHCQNTETIKTHPPPPFLTLNLSSTPNLTRNPKSFTLNC